ncbi:complex I intermediate-associated protein 30, mitochondrial-like isoform X2 [Convolutriloba macropyga]|uniref:complex I intermediate-associated protein 30, mitochondrial-like isoform X2 n=1 Tax=Convolutriloba macropyga TaxID=536237 RepID=UPI003F51E744
MKRFRNSLYRLFDLQLSWMHSFLNTEGVVPDSSRFSLGESVAEMKYSIKQWIHENKTEVNSQYRNQAHQEQLTLFKFDSEEIVNQWASMGDAEMGGRSKSTLAFGTNKKLLWTGNVDTAVPRDGTTFQSGYVGIRSRPFLCSFFRTGVIDLNPWNTIEIRLRGDGRRYHFNLQIDEQFEQTYEDLFFHPIFTRGGPYWEVIQIPFSHLVLSNSGIMAYQTSPPERALFRNMGFSLVEHFDGPFRLEIDYIKVLQDDAHKQAHAYEYAGATHGYDFGTKYDKI